VHRDAHRLPQALWTRRSHPCRTSYLLAVREFFRTRRFPRQVVFTCLALAALWRIPFLMMPPGSDDDIHRYLWDGRVQRLGYNPYSVIFADPALAGLHTPETRGLNNPEVPSPYPAGAQLFFRAKENIWVLVYASRYRSVRPYGPSHLPSSVRDAADQKDCF
jgi:hypothetical protein